MKKVLLIAAMFVSVSAFAQKKDSTAKKDSVIQPTTTTPLLSLEDIRILHDSAMQNVPYKFAPILDEINQWLVTRINQKAVEYVNAQKKGK